MIYGTIDNVVILVDVFREFGIAVIEAVREKPILGAPSFFDSPVTELGSFEQTIVWHMECGTRPSGNPSERGARWVGKVLALDLKVSPGALSNWRSGASRPDLGNISGLLNLFFGENPEYAEWRAHFLRVWNDTRARGATERVTASHDTVSQTAGGEAVDPISWRNNGGAPCAQRASSSQDPTQLQPPGTHGSAELSAASSGQIVAQDFSSKDVSRPFLSFAAVANSTLPIRPARCIGRPEVRELVDELLDPAGRRSILLIGAPGIGKSTLSRSIACNDGVIRFFGDRRCFVSLEFVRTAKEAISRIAQTSDVDIPTIIDNPKGRLAEGPTLIILDDIEDAFSNDQRSMETLLESIGSVSKLYLIATMRGYDRPLAPDWQKVYVVPPLNNDASRELFTRIAPDTTGVDPYRAYLLDAAGGVPLAIELIACRSARIRSLEIMWQEWKMQGSALATRPGVDASKLTSLDYSINLSFSSVSRHPVARLMLAVIAFLDNGADLSLLKFIFGDEAYNVLDDTMQAGLAFVDGMRAKCLPPIAVFVSSQKSVDEITHDKIIKYFEESLTFMHQNIATIEYTYLSRFLIMEQININRILHYILFRRGEQSTFETLGHAIFVADRCAKLKETEPAISLIRFLGTKARICGFLALRCLSRGQWSRVQEFEQKFIDATDAIFHAQEISVLRMLEELTQIAADANCHDNNAIMSFVRGVQEKLNCIVTAGSDEVRESLREFREIEALKPSYSMNLSAPDIDQLRLYLETIIERLGMKWDHKDWIYRKPLPLESMSKEEIVQHQEKIVNSYSEWLGPQDPQTLYEMANVAEFYRANQRMGDAIRVLMEELKLRRQYFPDHSKTIDEVVNTLQDVSTESGINITAMISDALNGN